MAVGGELIDQLPHRQILDVAILRAGLAAILAVPPAPVDAVVCQALLRAGPVNGDRRLSLLRLGVDVRRNSDALGAVCVPDLEAGLDSVHDPDARGHWVIAMLVLREGQDVGGALGDLGARADVVRRVLVRLLHDIPNEGGACDLLLVRLAPVQGILIQVLLVLRAADRHRPTHLALVPVLVDEAHGSGPALREHRVLQEH
mmetsp:Transcript_67914/g.196626  ORF Transcript_67914/g.196626 Transcript_67914/m.196626 type:complete len:201 (+) Transcript_67914:318-920(+)